MTEKQKSEVLRMRRSGVPYKEISALLGVSMNTVKSYCVRNNIHTGSAAEPETDTCPNCGKPIIQREKMKKRKFCSSECRIKWWNAHPEAVSRKANYTLRCASCGKDFVSYGNKNRKYCSHECYITARYRSQNGKKEAGQNGVI